MEKIILKYKKISFSILSIFLIYFLIIEPSETLLDYLNLLKSKEQNINILEQKQKVILKKINNLKIAKESLEKEYAIKKKQQQNFNSLGGLEKKVNQLLIKNNLTILELGRTKKLEKEIYIIPYFIKGNKNNVLNFILELDENKKIDLLNNFIEIKLNKDIAFLKFSIKVNIEIKKEKNIETLTKKNLELLEYILLNKNKGIFYFKTKNQIKKFYLKNNKEEKINETTYKIFLSKNKLILENLDDKTKIIFYLEEKIEKSNELH